MLKPNAPTLESLARLTQNGQDIVAWLRACYVEQTELLVSQPDESLLRQIQGRAQTLRELLKIIDDAPAAINKLRKP